MANSPKNRDAKARIPDLGGLREFSESTDRETPVAFVGREEQIGALKRDLEARFRQRQGWEGPGFPPAWEGATWLFQGAPGAGKTALLRRLKNLKVNGRAVRVCLIDDEADLYNDFRMKRKIAEAFVSGSAAKMVGTDTTQTGKGAKVGGGVSGFGARLEGSADASKGKSEQRAGLTWEDCVNKEKSQSSSPLLLLFDEAQALENQAGPQLRWLHKGEHGLPIVPVFGGLAWTKERFGELGISRFSAGRVHTLEALSKDERREVVRAFFEKFRVAGVKEAGKKWERRIADVCQGWPQHLHAGLQALAGGLVKGGVDGDLRCVDGKSVLEKEAARRKAYYQDRLGSAQLKAKRHLVAASVVRMPEGAKMAADDLADIIAGIHSETVAARAPSRLQLPEGHSPAKFVRAIIRAGILHEDGDGYLSVPIPSFRDFLEGLAPGTETLPSPAP